jgi:competence ComEA-like helix-hairpin-helix protein
MRSRLDVRLRRAHLFGVLFALAVASAWLLPAGRNQRFIGRVVPVLPAGVEAAAETIDPNSASAASLRRLPGVGVTRAQAIVEFRAGGAVFTTPEDLQAIPGIGPGTAGRIAPYLCFPPGPASPATAPASPAPEVAPDSPCG